MWGDFWDRVDRSAGFFECWPYMAPRSQRRVYGQVHYQGEVIRTHRLAYVLTYGPIPKGLVVRHKCDNPPCCNPTHLELGTHSQNFKDMWGRGRGRPGILRGSHNGHARLTEDQVTEIIRRYEAGGVSQRALGREYGVDSSNIGLIVHRKHWRHVK